MVRDCSCTPALHVACPLARLACSLHVCSWLINIYNQNVSKLECSSQTIMLPRDVLTRRKIVPLYGTFLSTMISQEHVNEVIMYANTY